MQFFLSRFFSSVKSLKVWTCFSFTFQFLWSSPKLIIHLLLFYISHSHSNTQTHPNTHTHTQTHTNTQNTHTNAHTNSHSHKHTHKLTFKNTHKHTKHTNKHTYTHTSFFQTEQLVNICDFKEKNCRCQF